ncbi:MAG: SDR family oxidoreductase [Chloroherpetonaceae bacterium]|nr:SDR family oxidoreductase [Chloroherpetonaceae bacterium]MCS7212389.1 SDR family oxidoreductase [Chloroherpetonaceae bacterium]MDW8018592.1 SDR family oxidoreductase [Chloroherpetonaceae bacterium]MDW8467304.1 SDR family oxidoreductase [Chloroherpetonaceae bacterium]
MSVILITGAGKGIGRALAIEFAQRASDTFKPKLFLASRTQADLEAVQQVCQLYSVETDFCTADLAEMAAVERLYTCAVQRFGQIDCLINNAGVGRFKPILELTEDDYDYTMNTNLKGTFFLTQKVFRDMQARQSGHIIFITSVAAFTPFEQSAIYCMSKFGQKGLIEVLRLYGRKCNVRITNVMPGAVYTPMWGEAGEHFRDRMMMPEDVAKIVVDAFLQPERTCVEEIVLRPIAGDLS